MANRILLTKSIFEWLIEHLVHVEENAGELASFYYPNLPNEQEKMKYFFTEYINKIESELENVDIIKSIDKFRYSERLNDFPFVIIGSHVKVTNLINNCEFFCKIIHPLMEGKNQRDNEITYLSPLGKELLLKSVKDEIIIKEPLVIQRIRIEKIKLS